MKVIDFSRSFVTFRIDTTKKPPKTVTHEPPFSVNSARVLIDCQCVIRDRVSEEQETFVLGASCKTERVGVERGIWTEPNADFVPVFSGTHFMHFKTYDRADKKIDIYPPGSGIQPEKQLESVAEAFDDVKVDIRHGDGELLETPVDIVDSTLRNEPLIARTELQNDRYRAVIEYPVKTMNASDRDVTYQTDTGPILLPDLSRNRDDLMAGMELAFAAFNTDSWAEFIVRCASPITDDVSVYHYSRTVRMDKVQNRLFRLVD